MLVGAAGEYNFFRGRVRAGGARAPPPVAVAVWPTWPFFIKDLTTPNPLKHPPSSTPVVQDFFHQPYYQNDVEDSMIS